MSERELPNFLTPYFDSPGGLLTPWQVSLSFGEAMDETLLRETWMEVINRHQALRTFFPKRGKSDVRLVRISDSADIQWHEVDWSREEPQSIGPAWLALLDSDLAERFDPAVFPLQRFTLITLPDGASHGLWSFPEVLLDEPSLFAVIQELLAIYDVRSRGENPGAAGAAEWMDDVEARFSGSGIASTDPLSTSPAAFRLPYEQNEKSEQNERESQGASRVSVTLPLSAEVGARCAEIARDYQVSIAQLPRAAWALTLGRLNASAETSFAEIRSFRDEDAGGRPIGRMSTLVHHRVALDPGAKVSDWIRALPPPYLAARRSSRQVRTILEVHPFDHGSDLVSDMPRWMRMDVKVLRAGHAVPVVVCHLAGNPRLEMIFDPARLDRNEATATLAQFAEALSAMSGDAGRLICQIGIIPEETIAGLIASARGEQRQDWRTGLPPQIGWDDADALVAGEGGGWTLSYGELTANSRVLAEHLRTLPASTPKVASISIGNHPWLAIALYGCWEAGFSVLPLTRENAAEAAEARMKRLKTGVVLVDSATAGNLQVPANVPEIPVDNLPEPQGPPALPLSIEATRPEHRALIDLVAAEDHGFVASEFSHGSLSSVARAIAEACEFGPSDRLLAGPGCTEARCLPALLAAWFSGSNVVFSAAAGTLDHIETLADQIDAIQPTVVLLSGEDFDTWARHLNRPGATRPAALRAVLLLGIDRATAAVQAWNRAGLGETPVIACWTPSPRLLPAFVKNWRTDPDPQDIGIPLRNVTALTMDDGHLVPDGVPAELVLSGDCLPSRLHDPSHETSLSEDPLGGHLDGFVFRTGLTVTRSSSGRFSTKTAIEEIPPIEEPEPEPAPQIEPEALPESHHEAAFEPAESEVPVSQHDGAPQTKAGPPEKGWRGLIRGLFGE